MRLVLRANATDRQVQLERNGDYDLRVVVVGGDFNAAASLLEPYGSFMDSETATILPDAIMRLVGESGDAGLLDEVEAMQFFAAEAGWIDERTSGIRAQCDWINESNC